MLAAVVVLLYLATLVLGVFLLLLYRQFGLLALGSAQAVRLPGLGDQRAVADDVAGEHDLVGHVVEVEEPVPGGDGER